MKVNLIIDLQWGSSGKGLIAGYLANHESPDVVITQWGPNAGHTFINLIGQKFVHTMVANGVVSPRLKTLLLGPGSCIEMTALRRELAAVRELGYLKDVDIIIHPQAAVVSPHHLQTEQALVSIGSTMKGTGAAMVERMMRDPSPENRSVAGRYFGTAMCEELGVRVSAAAYDAAIKGAETVQIESAQGYGLSLYHGFYPYATSRDVTPAQVLADTGVPLPSIHDELRVIGCARTYPIRVANRYDGEGNQIGTSGPCYADQEELSWESLGLEPELTTVTKLRRRIFSWSHIQMQEALWRVRPDYVFLNFANYEKDSGVLARKIHEIESAGTRVRYLGFGPGEGDIKRRVLTDPFEYTSEDRKKGWVP